MPDLQPSIGRIVIETMRQAPRRTRQSAGAALVLWTGLMVLQALDSADRSGAAGLAEFLSALCGSVAGLLFGLCGLLHAAAGQRAVLRLDASHGHRFRRVLLVLPVLGLASAAFASAAIVLVIVRALLGTAVPFVLVLGAFFCVLLVLATSMTVRSTRTLYAHAQAEAEAAAAARLGARDAHVAALQARMSPHFLFNALNTIASLVRTDSASAERAVENLAEILRTTVNRTGERMGTVGEEVAHVRAWLRLEQMRLGDRLTVTWDIAPGVEPLALPPMTIQPLVENALRHGIGSRIEGGVITISVRTEAGALVIDVSDDGVGFPPVHRERTGLGNLRERLQALHGDAARLDIRAQPHGATVSLRLPCGSGACAR
ncbi:MAG TPA: histidine kinase [Vicinamibacterales bacterium]|nr:histidine kinase [Vicinamibacterales bacterium]